MHFWAVACYDLRLSADEFYDLTPRQLDALLKRKKVETVANEYLFAQLTALVANTGFRSGKEPSKPSDFMPTEFHKTAPRPVVKRKRMTKRERAAVDVGLRAMFPNLKKKA